MPPELLVALSGLGLGLSLIVAIGSQNAFVLRQGLRRERVALVVLVCVVSDVVLIGAGVAGAGAAVESRPWLLDVVRWTGAAFLTTYGLMAAWRAWRPKVLDPSVEAVPSSVRAVVGTALALTWLNPHVYLDTVLLLGSLASGYGADGRWAFAAGAALGSVVWFVGLGYGARLASGLFARPGAWRVLDLLIGIVMLALAVSLVLH